MSVLSKISFLDESIAPAATRDFDIRLPYRSDPNGNVVGQGNWEPTLYLLTSKFLLAELGSESTSFIFGTRLDYLYRPNYFTGLTGVGSNSAQIGVGGGHTILGAIAPASPAGVPDPVVRMSITNAGAAALVGRVEFDLTIFVRPN